MLKQNFDMDPGNATARVKKVSRVWAVEQRTSQDCLCRAPQAWYHESSSTKPSPQPHFQLKVERESEFEHKESQFAENPSSRFGLGWLGWVGLWTARSFWVEVVGGRSRIWRT